MMRRADNCFRTTAAEDLESPSALESGIGGGPSAVSPTRSAEEFAEMRKRTESFYVMHTPKHRKGKRPTAAEVSQVHFFTLCAI